MSAARAYLGQPLADVLGPRVGPRITAATGCATAEELLRHLPRRYAERGELTDLGSVRTGQEVTVLVEVRQTVRSTPYRRGQRPRLTVTVTDGTHTLTCTFFHRVPWHESRLFAGVRVLISGRVSTYRGQLQMTHPEYVTLEGDGGDGGRGPAGEPGAAASEPAGGDDEDDAAARFAGGLIPVYPTRGGEPSWRVGRGITTVLRGIAAAAGPDWREAIDPLPAADRARHRLLSLGAAYEAVHEPDTRADVDAGRRRLAFDEALILQLALGRQRQEVRATRAAARVPPPDGLLAAFDARLPYPLTGAQQRAGVEILGDLAEEWPMHRLLQGDVGSGKTVVALRAMLAVVDAGGQAALLAPTEVLAAQHERSLRTLLGPLADRGLLGGHAEATRVALLTGSVPTAERRRILAHLLGGEVGIVVGTHALLEDRVQFADLGLVVVDEQHRFGVAQRSRLAERAVAGRRPHVLVMTATPIPRTVAMTVFGDLDVTTLDELPPGRAGITTHWVSPQRQPQSAARVWQRAREEIAGGGKVYVVAPRIGEDGAGEDGAGSGPPDGDDDGPFDGGDGGLFDRDPPDGDPFHGDPLDGGLFDRDPPDAPSAPSVPLPDDSGTVLTLHARLASGELADQRVGLIHGRLSADDKDAAMRRFGLPAADPDALDVLVATTVIEVGVDVADATMIVLTNADRLGISQLHQLRGRVGRGERPGLCIVLSDASPDSPAGERLAAVAATTDGFALAEADVRTRREGDVLGTRQSGWRSGLRVLRVLRDRALIAEARELAGEMLIVDPELTSRPVLAERVARVLADARSENLARS
ncbi:MAG: ATP-dependent DNA helicase RecG [Actinomycetales bacterium]|nr:ATP-dependent DNA helicase RecG [Actinomycetales bacterium]